jgi:hypothetical protein
MSKERKQSTEAAVRASSSSSLAPSAPRIVFRSSHRRVSRCQAIRDIARLIAHFGDRERFDR